MTVVLSEQVILVKMNGRMTATGKNQKKCSRTGHNGHIGDIDCRERSAESSVMYHTVSTVNTS